MELYTIFQLNPLSSNFEQWQCGARVSNNNCTHRREIWFKTGSKKLSECHFIQLEPALKKQRIIRWQTMCPKIHKKSKYTILFSLFISVSKFERINISSRCRQHNGTTFFLFFIFDFFFQFRNVFRIFWLRFHLIKRKMNRNGDSFYLLLTPKLIHLERSENSMMAHFHYAYYDFVLIRNVFTGKFVFDNRIIV